MMRKLLVLIMSLMVCMCVASADAAKQKAKENRFKSMTDKQNVVEEEARSNVRKRVSKKVGCGHDHPIQVAGFVTNAPFGWVNVIPAKGTRAAQYINGGFSYDLFSQMIKDLGLNIKNVGYTSYQEAMRDLRLGKIDVVAGGYFDKRILGTGVNLMFPGYFTNPIIPIFVKGQEKQIRSFDDLRGLRGVVRQEENIYSLIFNQLPKDIQLQQVSGSKKAFTMLMTGEADYILTSLYAGEAEVRRYKLVDDIYFSPQALVSPEMFFIFSSHSDCRLIKKQLEPALKKMKANEKEYMATFISYIDEWGQRFKDTPGLMEELEKAKNNQAVAVSEEGIASDSSDITLLETDSEDKESELNDQNADLSDLADTEKKPDAKKKANEPEKKDSSDLPDSKTPAASKEEPAPLNRPLTAAERVRNL